MGEERRKGRKEQEREGKREREKGKSKDREVETDREEWRREREEWRMEREDGREMRYVCVRGGGGRRPSAGPAFAKTDNLDRAAGYAPPIPVDTADNPGNSRLLITATCD